jgi:hypothetical protein
MQAWLRVEVEGSRSVVRLLPPSPSQILRAKAVTEGKGMGRFKNDRRKLKEALDSLRG